MTGAHRHRLPAGTASADALRDDGFGAACSARLSERLSRGGDLNGRYCADGRPHHDAVDRNSFGVVVDVVNPMGSISYVSRWTGSQQRDDPFVPGRRTTADR